MDREQVTGPEAKANPAPVHGIVRQSGDPESEEMFDDEFAIGDLDATGIAARIDAMMADLHRDAGELVRRWFLQHRYVNVSTASFVDHDKDADIITCKVVVSCWGLPEATRLAIDPFTNESKRYPVDAELPKGWRWF